MKYAIVATVATVITLFAVQNTASTSIRFLFWSLGAFPLASIILLSVASGIVLVGVPLWVDRWRLRARIRALEARAVTPEAPLADRERSASTAPPLP